MTAVGNISRAGAGSQARLACPLRLGDEEESKVRGSLDEGRCFCNQTKPWFYLEIEGVILEVP